jgi:hypothetical protein
MVSFSSAGQDSYIRSLTAILLFSGGMRDYSMPKIVLSKAKPRQQKSNVAALSENSRKTRIFSCHKGPQSVRCHLSNWLISVAFYVHCQMK